MTVTFSLDDYRHRRRHDPPPADAAHLRRDAETTAGPAPHHSPRFTLSPTLPPAAYPRLDDILADGLVELSGDIERYVQIVPLDPQDSGAGDAERFLRWLSERGGLNEELSSRYRPSRRRHDVEFVAVRQRLAHVRFQELLSMNDRLLRELDTNARLTVHLNPIHVWSRVETSAADSSGDARPRAALFFPVGAEIRMATLDPDSEDLVRLVERHEVLQVRELQRHFRHDAERGWLGRLRTLVAMGAMALG